MASLYPKRLVSIAVASVVYLLLLYHLAEHTVYIPSAIRNPPSIHHDAAFARDIRRAISAESKNLVDHPLPNTAFGKMGERTEKLTWWLQQAAEIAPSLNEEENDELLQDVEDAIVALYPFLKSPVDKEDPLPFTTIRQRIEPGSRGIVIAAGKKQFRFTTHLIGNLRNVLHSALPIQVVYAGDHDLPQKYRDALTSLGLDIETLDVLTVVDDTTLRLKDRGWAIKPYALLASKFEQVLLMDADAIFVQKPEVIFEKHDAFLTTGTLLFHDRLLWQNKFKARAKWWREQMANRTPSAALQKSKVWNEGYAEEGDSGVIAYDKGKLPLLMALLHICWQNSYSVRTKITYRMTYGDKESWWFGLELCGVPYAFENHYGAVLGETTTENGETKVCGFTIAHVGSLEHLLWFNGSLLKNKMLNQTEFLVPDWWMIDAEWLKGALKKDPSCMRGGEVRTVEPAARVILEDSVQKAKEMDQRFADLIGPLR